MPSIPINGYCTLWYLFPSLFISVHIFLQKLGKAIKVLLQPFNGHAKICQICRRIRFRNGFEDWIRNKSLSLSLAELGKSRQCWESQMV
jgi:hypothetical protein